MLIMFHLVFNSCLLADKQDETQENDYEIVMGAPRVTLTQAKTLARDAVSLLKLMFDAKVETYSNIKIMSKTQAQKGRLRCRLYDPLELISVISFQGRQRDTQISEELERWFEENEKEELKIIHNEQDRVLMATIPLRVNDNCKACHPTYKNIKVAGAMVYNIPLIN